jgi:hypothetical protein
LGEAVEAPVGLDQLEEALLAWHRLPKTLDDALRIAHEADEALAACTVGSAPNWRGTAEAGLPEVAEIEAVVEALEKAQSQRDALAALRDEAERDLQSSRSARDALGARPDIVLDPEIAASRARRDEAGQKDADPGVDLDDLERSLETIADGLSDTVRAFESITLDAPIDEAELHELIGSLRAFVEDISDAAKTAGGC